MVKLSFIVPIYNVKDYLRKCVNSLLAQDYDDYEIILVDDGSTDGSGELADEIARSKIKNQKSPIIKVLHQENKGLSTARNAGIELACGDYICFVDSDDYWEENVLGGLMTQIERDNLDVLRFRWQNVHEDGAAFWPYKDSVDYNDYSANPVDGLTFLNTRMDFRCYAVQFIIRKSILFPAESSLLSPCLFTEGILFEDTDWTPRMLSRAHNVASADTMVYNYLWREGSITLSQSIEKKKQELRNKIALISRLKDYQFAGRTSISHGSWYDGMIAMLMISIIGIVSGELWNERETYLDEIASLGITRLSTYKMGNKAQRKIRLMNLNMRFAIWMLHLKNKK